ncbi:hypothetical protein GCM10027161_59540 [Microbispora hainanensis]
MAYACSGAAAGDAAAPPGTPEGADAGDARDGGRRLGRVPLTQLTSGYGGTVPDYETVPLRIGMTNATLALRNSVVSKSWGNPWKLPQKLIQVTHAGGRSSA